MVVVAVNRSMERSLVVEPASDEAAEVDAEDTEAPLRHTRRGTFLFNYDTPESTRKVASRTVCVRLEKPRRGRQAGTERCITGRSRVWKVSN